MLIFLQRTQCFQRGRRWQGVGEISQRTYIHICIAHGHRQQCVNARGWGVGGGDQGGKMGDLCNSVNNKKEEWDTPYFTRSTKTTKNMIKKWKEDMIGIYPKRTYRWLTNK